MGSKSKFSEHGLPLENRVDVDALSPASRYKVRTLPLGDFTQNTTTKFSRGPVGFVGTLVSGYLTFRTVPAGGALSVTVKAYDASANAEVALTAALDPETATAREGLAFTLAATNAELAADDTIEFHVAADNNAVGTQQVDGYVTLVFDPTEDTVISD